MRREGISEKGAAQAKARRRGREERFEEGQAVHVAGEQSLQRRERDLVQKMSLEMGGESGPVTLRSPAGHGDRGFPNRG